MASRLTIKRFDPWSVLKFGAVANLALLAIFMLIAGVMWFIIDRLELVDQACSIAADIGFTTCGVNAGNLFRALALLGLLWVVVQTAVWVFFAFLHNLIADLTGGLVVGVVEEPAARREHRPVASATTPPARSPRAATPRTPSPQRAAPVSDDEQPAPQRSSSETGGDSLFGSRH